MCGRHKQLSGPDPHVVQVDHHPLDATSRAVMAGVEQVGDLLVVKFIDDEHGGDFRGRGFITLASLSVFDRCMVAT